MIVLYVVAFTIAGMALIGLAFYGLCYLLDWQCERCLERDPDNKYCCE
jgi:hypothetical protein